MSNDGLKQALDLFALAWPFNSEQLDKARTQLLHTWNPHRYANLTNNPKKYMQAYKQAEEMTRLIESSYLLLSASISDHVSDDQHSC